MDNTSHYLTGLIIGFLVGFASFKIIPMCSQSNGWAIIVVAVYFLGIGVTMSALDTGEKK
jgi:TM2 domain-containing membrane protein YozV